MTKQVVRKSSESICQLESETDPSAGAACSGAVEEKIPLLAHEQCSPTSCVPEAGVGNLRPT